MTANTPQNQNQDKDQNHPDRQEPGQGKVENDHNRTGHQEPTQKNEGQRTPDSRSDRTDQVGSGNQAQSRRGSKNQGGAG